LETNGELITFAMEIWRDRYRKNFLRGIAVSVAIHFFVIIIIFIFTLSSKEGEQKYFISTYTVQITNLPSSDTTWGGGGSFGTGLEELGKGTSAPPSVAGTPVPSAKLDNIEFGNVTNLEIPKDSLTGSGGGIGKGSGNGVGDGTGNGYGFGSGIGSGFKQLPYMPRQILEVVPQNVEGVKGTIILILKIGTDGYVKEHKVIYDTINNHECLKSVTEAAYKSRWEKIKMEGRQIEYWLEKSYRFN
jgi:hypothetical protein